MPARSRTGPARSGHPVVLAGGPARTAPSSPASRLGLALGELTIDEPTGLLWREGNTPFALQRWELPGLRDQLDAADRLAGATGD
ncbi:hypothetical protein [Streptomyces sp. NPDC057748]|uniref:hypothetical protein n=1 Tax=Streptomyces sp. NPDC057748 TaxID=3346239 RepID=UPI0036AC58B1